MPENHPAHAQEQTRDSLIARAEHQHPGISELMQVYEAAESAYRATVSNAPVRVATSTN